MALKRMRSWHVVIFLIATLLIVGSVYDLLQPKPSLVCRPDYVQLIRKEGAIVRTHRGQQKELVRLPSTAVRASLLDFSYPNRLVFSFHDSDSGPYRLFYYDGNRSHELTRVHGIPYSDGVKARIDRDKVMIATCLGTHLAIYEIDPTSGSMRRLVMENLQDNYKLAHFDLLGGKGFFVSLWTDDSFKGTSEKTLLKAFSTGGRSLFSSSSASYNKAVMSSDMRFVVSTDMSDTATVSAIGDSTTRTVSTWRPKSVSDLPLWTIRHCGDLGLLSDRYLIQTHYIKKDFTHYTYVVVDVENPSDYGRFTLPSRPTIIYHMSVDRL